MTEENVEPLQAVSEVESCSSHIAIASGNCSEAVIEGGVIPISELLPQTVSEVNSASTIAVAIPFNVNGNLPEGAILHITPDTTIVTLESVNALQSAGQLGNTTIILSDPSQCPNAEVLHTSNNESEENVEQIHSKPMTLDEVIEENVSAPPSDLVSKNAHDIEEIDLARFLTRPDYNSGTFPSEKVLQPEERTSNSSDNSNLETVLERQDDLSSISEIQQNQEDTQSEDVGTTVNTDQTAGSDSNIVVVDISKPIQLSQNSLIVVNGQKCILQQDPQTGQVFAYPLREPDKPKRKRGRPRKIISEAQQSEDSTAELSLEPLPEEEPHERGMLEVANEDGTIVRRSARKRKQANTLKDYETGNLKLVLGSEEEDDREEADLEVKDEHETDSPPKKRGRGRGRPKKNSHQTLSLASSPFSFLQPVKRGRGRPRRYGLPKEAMQAFLIQTADGQALMMQVPMSSIPSGMSLQDVAEGIANSLNMAPLPQPLLGKIEHAKLDKQGSDQESPTVEGAAAENPSSACDQIQEVEMQDLNVEINLCQSEEKNDNSGVEERNILENLDENILYNKDIKAVNSNQIISKVINGTHDNINQDIVSEIHSSSQDNLIEPNDNDNMIIEHDVNDVDKEIKNTVYHMNDNNKIIIKEVTTYTQDVIDEIRKENLCIINDVLSNLLNEVERISSTASASKNIFQDHSFENVHSHNAVIDRLTCIDPVHNACEVNTVLITEKFSSESQMQQAVSTSKEQHIENIPHSSLPVLTVPFKPKRRPGRPRKHPLPSLETQSSIQKGTSCEISPGNKLEQQITNLPLLASVLPVSQVTSSASETSPVVTAPATVIPLSDKLLPLLLPKSDSPVKLGLKANETELEKLHCPRCDFQAYYLHQYQEHLAIHAEAAFQCKCCSFLCFDDDELIQHYKDHHPRCICFICNHTADHAYIIKRHMYRHSESGCSCDICGKTYKDHYILKMHVKMVHLPAEVLFECNVCSKKFNRKAHLKRHLRTHDPDKPFKCDLCEYRGCEKSDITKHTLIHEEPKHSCEICGKAFRHLKNKELHLKRHKGQRDYKCGVCEFYGYTFTDVRKHIERRHSDPRTIFCNQCGQVFKSEELLKVHQDSNQCEVYMIEQSLEERETVIHIPADDDAHIDENIEVPSVQLTESGDQEISGIPTITLEDGSVATLNTLANIQDSTHLVVKGVDSSSVLASEDTQIVVSGIPNSGVVIPNGQLAIMSEEGRTDAQV